jgi:hypothetical protein
MPPDAVKSLGNEMLRRIASGAFDAPEFPEEHFEDVRTIFNIVSKNRVKSVG